MTKVVIALIGFALVIAIEDVAKEVNGLNTTLIQLHDVREGEDNEN